MKIGLLGDTHIGVRRFRAQENMVNLIEKLNNDAFKEAMEILDKETDRTIIAGDVFDSPNPTITSLINFNEAIKNKRLSVIAGNHDYSAVSDYNGYHVFDVLSDGEILNSIDNGITDFKKYNNGVGFEVYDDLTITYLPYKYLNEDSFKLMHENLNKQNILIMHGRVDYHGEQEEIEYDLPRSIAEEYDLVVAGHVHLPSVVQLKKGQVLTPGSLTPSSRANSKTPRPSVWIYDTETKELKSIELQTPPTIYELAVEDGKINEALLEVSAYKNKYNLVFIQYNGRLSDIDQAIYQKAFANTILLSFKTIEFEEKEVKDVKDFWSYVKNSYPEYEQEFRKVLLENGYQ